MNKEIHEKEARDSLLRLLGSLVLMELSTRNLSALTRVLPLLQYKTHTGFSRFRRHKTGLVGASSTYLSKRMIRA